VLSAGLLDLTKNVLSKAVVMRQYPAVFSQGRPIGCLDGKYPIPIDSTIPPV